MAKSKHQTSNNSTKDRNESGESELSQSPLETGSEHEDSKSSIGDVDEVNTHLEGGKDSTVNTRPIGMDA